MMQSDTKDRKLFIGGLNHDTVERTLQGYFEQWGEVTDCVIMKDNAGKSRGFGFITYKETFELQNAQSNRVHVIDDKEVDAKLAVPKDYEQVDTNRDQLRKLFIGGLNYETTVEGLEGYFGQFGSIVECNVMKDGEGRSRGFGFVKYSDVSGLDEAQRRRPHTIDGKEVETKRAMPKDSGENNMTVKKMFVGGLKEDTTEEMIQQVFSEFGEIEDIDILKDKSNGRPRGFCFVVFKDYDSVDRAVLIKRHDLNGFKVEVRKAVGKDQMAPRGPGPRRFGGAKDRWMDGPPRNFSRGRGRFDRGGGGDGNFRGRGGSGYGGYNDNFGGPPNGGRGGYNNFGGGGYNNNFGDGGYNNNFGGGGNSGGGGFGNFSGGGNSFGGSGSSGNYSGSGSGGNYSGSGSGGNYSGSGSGGNYGGSGSGGNYGGSGNFGGGGGGFNSYGGSSGDGSSGGGFSNFGGSSGGSGYQQQNWSGSGSGYSDNNVNWGSNSGGGGFGNNYNSDYSGGPVKSGSGFTARSQGPYGGGYGSGGNNNTRGDSGGGGSSW